MNNQNPKFNRESAMRAFRKRKDMNMGKQINNSSLQAGSPMYFYCRFCGVQTDVLPESYTTIPCKICSECDHLHELKLI
jgi:hypothetical protein